MSPIDIPAIERQARLLRAQEIQRFQGLFVERVRVYLLLLGNSLLTLLVAASEALRPAFSWNPQAAPRSLRVALGVRLNRLVRALFAWNPRKGRTC